MRALACLLLLGCGPVRPAGGEGAWIRTIWSPSRRQGHGATTNRVNSPDTATGRFKDRPEAKADGVLELELKDDPAALAGAELYLELWGGHPGTSKKSFTLNGHGPYALPEVGAAEKHCTYSYPAVALDPAHLLRGKNVFRFTCDRGSTFWGHFLFEIAALRAVLREPPLAATARVRARAGGEKILLELESAGEVEEVVYEGLYAGYDENGDGEERDWHGFTKEGRPEAVLGTSKEPPFGAAWDLAMVPDQEAAEIRARVRFKGDPSLTYVTPAVRVPLPARPGRSVALCRPAGIPAPFWSRASRPMICSIPLPEDPARVERAELHVAIWDGGRGTTPEPFTLNGRALPVAGGGRHDLLYRVVPVDPSWLRAGDNEVRVLSDTEHHGLEVLLPGPALVVRLRR